MRLIQNLSLSVLASRQGKKEWPQRVAAKRNGLSGESRPRHGAAQRHRRQLLVAGIGWLGRIPAGFHWKTSTERNRWTGVASGELPEANALRGCTRGRQE